MGPPVPSSYISRYSSVPAEGFCEIWVIGSISVRSSLGVPVMTPVRRIPTDTEQDLTPICADFPDCPEALIRDTGAPPEEKRGTNRPFPFAASSAV